MRWLFILLAKALIPPPLPVRVALERGLKQHQRPCTQITRLALERRAGWEDGRVRFPLKNNSVDVERSGEIM